LLVTESTGVVLDYLLCTAIAASYSALEVGFVVELSFFLGLDFKSLVSWAPSAYLNPALLEPSYKKSVSCALSVGAQDLRLLIS